MNISKYILDLYDFILDLKYCGKSLLKVIPQLKEYNHYYTNTQCCRYIILKKVTKRLKLSKNDHLLEVGFGTGRALIYLASKYNSASFSGIEINPISYNFCLQWLHDDKIKLICDDVFNINLNKYTALFIGHPFFSGIYELFIDKVETELTHSITLICVIDLEYNLLLDKKNSWSLIGREEIYKYGLLYLLNKPNRFSIWLYNPQ